MLRLTCKNCKEEVVVNPHLYDTTILVEEDPMHMRRGYTARVRSETICPRCGNHMYNYHTCPISTSDIVDLALRREVHV